MTKQNGNCFTSAYHKLLQDSESMSKQAYDMIYTSLNAVYEEKINESMDACNNAFACERSS